MSNTSIRPWTEIPVSALPGPSPRRRAKKTPKKKPSPRLPSKPVCLSIADYLPYEVCLTPNQQKILFKGEKPKKLKCGMQGCAYIGPGRNRVVKLTRDPEDPGGFLKAQKARSPDVAKLTAAYKLAQPGEMYHNGVKVPVYALVVDRLQLLPEEVGQASIDRRADKIFDAVSAEPGREYSRELRRACARHGSYSGESLDPVCVDTVNLVRRLHQQGIPWMDIHAGNFGYDREGRLQVLDMGNSTIKPPSNLAVLERPSTRRRYRRRSR